MNKFILQLLSLIIFATFISIAFSAEIAFLKESAIGWTAVIILQLALGWYWTDIYNHIERKIKSP